MTYPNVYATQTGPLALSSLDANFLYAVDIANGALSATAGGTADAITATYSPAPAALVAGLTLYVRAASANATTTPQFSPNGLTGKVIVKNNNQALAVGDIAGAGHWLHLVYDATNGVWELMNPATFIGAVQTGGTANGVAYLNASKVLTTGTALTFDGTNFATTGAISTSNNLTFTGTGNRILGDFTNATFSSRTAFQTSTANSTTGIYALPSGTSTAASWQATNNADPTNASKILIATNGSTDVQLVSGINGTGTYLPMTFYTGGSERMRIVGGTGSDVGNVGIGWIGWIGGRMVGCGPECGLRGGARLGALDAVEPWGFAARFHVQRWGGWATPSHLHRTPRVLGGTLLSP